MDISYKRSATAEELDQILELQRKNLPSRLKRSEVRSEGFVTVRHDFPLLKRMHDKCPHVLATQGDTLAGYALCMHPDFRREVTVLRSMFAKLRDILPEQSSYLIMGQICIARPFRRKGVFKGLYEFMRSQLRDEFDMLITEVDGENQRSLGAHLAMGFKELMVYKSGSHKWHLISWKW